MLTISITKNQVRGLCVGGDMIILFFGSFHGKMTISRPTHNQIFVFLDEEIIAETAAVSVSSSTSSSLMNSGLQSGKTVTTLLKYLFLILIILIIIIKN